MVKHPAAAERAGSDVLQLPRGRQLPGLPRRPRGRRPARPRPVRGAGVHAGADALDDSGDEPVGHGRRDEDRTSRSDAAAAGARTRRAERAATASRRRRPSGRGRPPADGAASCSRSPSPRRWLIGVVVALVCPLRGRHRRLRGVNRIDTCAQCHVIEPEVDDVRAVGPLRRRRRVPGLPHQAGRLQLLRPQPPGRDAHRQQHLGHLSEADHDLRRAPTTASSAIPRSEIERDIVVGNIRVNHTGLREEGYQCLTCHANISHPGTQLEVGAHAPGRRSCRCARGATTASSCPTTATSATSAVSRRATRRSR